MNFLTTTNRKLFAASMLAFSFLLGLAIIHVQAAANDSSVTLKRPKGSEAFTLTIKDPDGIQEFSLSPVHQFRYGGMLSGCNKTFSSEYVSFNDPVDFTPVMPAYIIDCQNNTTELEIPPPVEGTAKSVVVKKEEPPPPPPPPPLQEEKKEELVKKSADGSLLAEDIQYPVPELGNCQNEAECRSYCDNANHAKECLAFAKKYNLISDEESKEAADKFLNIKNGPGGCNSWITCENYCSSINHLDECIAFAEETGYYSGDELSEARKFQELVKSGEKFPGGCKDRNSCEVYCGDPNHMEECLNFAEKSGFMPREEIDEARKFMVLMRQGESPGGCASKEQCEKYCFEEGHVNECIDFALKAGVMTEEDAKMARKVGGKGPGGCRSKTQCEAYCEEHSEECFNFAKEHGLMSEEDLERMSKGMEQFRDNLDKMPPEAVQCLEEALGEENFEKIKNGQPIFDRSMEGKMKSCFGKMTADLSQKLDKLPIEATQCIKDAVGEEGLKKLQSGEFGEDLNFESLEGCFQQLQGSFGGGGNFGDGGFQGPGGCTTMEECVEYCTLHHEECEGFGPPGGGGGGFPGGPGGCRSPEECQAYCQEHPDECGGMGGSGAGGSTGGSTGSTGGGFGGSFSGPGGCTSIESCTTYCQEHHEDQQCQAYVGGGGNGGGTPLPSPTSSCVPPPSDLVSWWSADIVSGTTVSDISDGNNGTISSGVTAVPMEVGDAFEFDGSSGHINMGNPANLNFGTGPFSLEAWFNWDGGGRSSSINIIRKSNYPFSGPGSGYWLRVGRDTRVLEFYTGETVGIDGDYPRGAVSTPISPNTWHHAVATRNSSGTMKLYVDGELKGTTEAKNAETTSDTPFVLGAWDDRFGITELFSGMIDEIAVYARALDSTEVQALFDAGSIGKCATSYGRTNRELPQDYQQPQSQPTTNFSGPGGCTNKEECTAYCTKNYQDPSCQQFMPSGGTQPPSSARPRGFFASVIEFFWNGISGN